MVNEKSIGVVGCGTIVREQYVHVLRRWPNVFLFDVNEANAQEVSKKIRATVCKNIAQLVQSAEVIIIATPVSSHYSILKEVLQPGKTVIVEKPFLLSSAQAAEILEIASLNNADLRVAHIRRVFPATLMAKQLVQSGVLGELKQVQMFEGAHFRYQSASGYIINDELGGVLPDMGSHTLDQALFITGMDEAKAFSADVIYAETDKTEPSHTFKADAMVNGIPFKLNLSRRGALANKLNLQFENGWLEVPVGLIPKLVLTSAKGKTIIPANYRLNSFAEAFLLQYTQMFQQQTQQLFNAERFINLTQLLEKLFHHPKNITK